MQSARSGRRAGPARQPALPPPRSRPPPRPPGPGPSLSPPAAGGPRGWLCRAAGRPFPCAALWRAPARRGDVSTGGGCGRAEPGALAGLCRRRATLRGGPRVGLMEACSALGPGGGRGGAASRHLAAPAVRAISLSGERCAAGSCWGESTGPDCACVLSESSLCLHMSLETSLVEVIL